MTYEFARPSGTAECQLPDGKVISLPVFFGLLKTLSHESLEESLKNPYVAKKYTQEALRIAAWQILRHFPREWLLACLDSAKVRSSRCAAIRFLLED